MLLIKTKFIKQDIPVKRMTTFAITDEERSTLSIVPVTGAAKHRIGAMHSTVSLIKPGEMISKTL